MIVGIAVLSSLILGGSGAPAPVAELSLQALTALFVAAWFWSLPAARLRVVSRDIWLIAALVVGLPLVQLLPLPPALWHHLAGRELESGALGMVGLADSWQPWSLAPSRTFAALLAMTSAAAILIMVASGTRAHRNLVLGAIAFVAVLSLLVGAVQLSAGANGALQFYQMMPGFLNGFQANHNSEADVLLVGMLAVAALTREIMEHRRRPGETRFSLGFAAGLMALLALGVVLTGSRGGIALLVVAVFGAVAILRPRFRPGLGSIAMGLTVVAVLAAAATLGLHDNAALDRVVARFKDMHEFRPEIWRDSLFAAQQYLPWGTGMGSFVPVFAAVERLEVVSDMVTNHAHNDYLEFLIEAGLPGVLVLSLILARLCAAAVRGFAQPPVGSRAHHIFAISVFCIIALHSLIDYPLRSMALSCIAASCAGLLIPSRGQAGRNGHLKDHS